MKAHDFTSKTRNMHTERQKENHYQSSANALFSLN